MYIFIQLDCYLFYIKFHNPRNFITQDGDSVVAVQANSLSVMFCDKSHEVVSLTTTAVVTSNIQYSHYFTGFVTLTSIKFAHKKKKKTDRNRRVPCCAGMGWKHEKMKQSAAITVGAQQTTKVSPTVDATRASTQSTDCQPNPLLNFHLHSINLGGTDCTLLFCK